MVCPGSVHLPPDVPGEGSSEYASKGTAMHMLSEHCANTRTEPLQCVGMKFNDHVITKDMVEIVEPYVAFLNEVQGKKIFEAKITLEAAIKDCFGTADCIVMRPGYLAVVDLKTGYEPVDPEENTQLLCYALGAYLMYNWVYDFKKVDLVIFQPRDGKTEPKTWNTDVDRLLNFQDELSEAVDRIETEPTKYVLSDKGCRWCRSQSQCPEKRKLVTQAAAMDFANVDSDDELLKFLNMKDHVIQFFDAIENKAKDKLLNGGKLAGWKVASGRKSRDWEDPVKAETLLKEKGFGDKIYTEPQFLSVAQVEKVIKGSDVSLDGLVKVTLGKPTLTREKDPRPATTRASQAAADFNNVVSS